MMKQIETSLNSHCWQALEPGAEIMSLRCYSMSSFPVLQKGRKWSFHQAPIYHLVFFKLLYLNGVLVAPTQKSTRPIPQNVMM